MPGAWPLGRWCHVAMVTGKGGAHLYLNGLLLGSNPFTGSLSGVSGQTNYFGRANIAGTLERFHGEMDEFRVWKTARTEEQIRATMFQRLTGQEPGLAGLWNFDDGTANDASPAGHHGKLVDGARCVPAPLPGGPAELLSPALIYGQVVDAEGREAPAARVGVEAGGVVLVSGETDANGRYQLAVYSTNETHEVAARLRDQGTRQADVALQAGERLELNLTVEAAVSIAGTVLGLDGVTRMPSVVVMLTEPIPAGVTSTAGGDPFNPRVLSTHVSDEKGEFKFGNLASGKYQVVAHGPDPLPFDGGKVIEFDRAAPLTNVNFSFAPAKKGAWRNYDFRDGLANDAINAIHTDADGTMWFGTLGGVARFDGREFVSFTKEDGLPGNSVNALTRDTAGVMWMGTGHGLTRFDQSAGQPGGT